jgi:flagella basal body P-ring formation protein FlgA
MTTFVRRLAAVIMAAAVLAAGHAPPRADATLWVPVLRATVGLGEVIGADDIDVIELPFGRVPRNAITDPQNLIGMTPKRLLRPGLPIRDGDVTPPLVVKKNTVVMMVFERGGLFLTAKGKALQNGGAGEVIRVENLQSGIVIQGEVQADGRVAVGFGDTVALN